MFIQECLGPGIPFSRIIDLETMTEVFRLENNDKLWCLTEHPISAISGEKWSFYIN